MAEDHRQNVPDDRYARQSFTFRRMKRWQVWSISIAAAVIVLALILYAVWI